TTTDPLRPGDERLVVARFQAVELTADLINGNSRQGVLVHVHPDHDHLRCLLPLGATGERTGLTQGNRPSSYQVTLDGLGKAAATQHWKVSPRATIGNRVSRRPTESLATTGRSHELTMTVSSGISLEHGDAYRVPPRAAYVWQRGRGVGRVARMSAL